MTATKQGRPTIYTESEAYERKLDSGRRSYQRKSSAAADIGEIPKPANVRRRNKALKDFQYFKQVYHAPKFYLPSSDDHRRLDEALVEAIDSSGLDEPRAFAFPRGTGKTTNAWIGCQWAVLRGSKRFPVIVGANAPKGEAILKDIYDDLTTNTELAADFPEVCIPLIALDGDRRRCDKQTYTAPDGERYRTEIELSDNRLILPWVRKSKVAQHAFAAYGITSKGIRGEHFLHKPSGQIIRPDLIILDDVQNDENAISPAQCDKIIRTIEKGVMKLRGPKRPLSVFMPCTVIYKGDVADQYTDRKMKKRWRGIRVAMLKSMPDNMDEWQRYFEHRDDLYEAQDDPTEIARLCNEYYEHRRDTLDAGAEASWKHNYDDGEVSAIQHAMHLYQDDKDSFYSECQNDPQPIGGDDRTVLPAHDIARKTNGLPRGKSPLDTQAITGFIDVQQDYLYYGVVAFDRHSSGSILDYGPFPSQNRRYWTKDDDNLATYWRKAKSVLGPKTGWTAALEWALAQVVASMCDRTWKTEEDELVKMSRLLIDGKWGKSSATVKRFCRRTHYPQVMPSQGFGFTATTKPITEDKAKAGERIGHNWKISRPKGWPVKLVTIDTNRWKTDVHQGWRTPLGDRGCLSLFDAPPREHKMFADMQHAEFRSEVEGRWGKLDIWKQYPNRPDNEGLDVLVGCCVAASIEGIGEDDGRERRRRKGKTRLSDVYARKQREIEEAARRR